MHKFKERMRSRSPQPDAHTPQLSTSNLAETASMSKQLPQRTLPNPSATSVPYYTSAASTAASKGWSKLDEKPLPAPPAQEPFDRKNTSSIKDPWDEAYEQLRAKQPDVVATYEDFILRQGQSKKSATRAALRDLTPFDGSNRQKQLRQVLEEQQKLYEDKQWEIKVHNSAFHVGHLLRRI